jgi:hypothetical protein
MEAVMRAEQTEDVVFGTPNTHADVFWRISDAFDADYALQMLTRDARRALATAIEEWILGGGGTPNPTAVRYNLPRMLNSTPFAVFGKDMHDRVARLVLDSVWPTYEEK